MHLVHRGRDDETVEQLIQFHWQAEIRVMELNHGQQHGFVNDDFPDLNSHQSVSGILSKYLAGRLQCRSQFQLVKRHPKR